MFNVLIPDGVEPPFGPEEMVFAGRASIVAPHVRDASELERAVWSNADAVLAWHEITIGARVIGWLDRCRVIVRVGVGFDNVDLAAAAQRGIPVCNVPDYGTHDVADHALALYLTMARRIVLYDEATRAGNWAWTNGSGPLSRISDSTIGVIGLGRIGTAAARRFAVLGASVVFYDPYKEDGYDKALGIHRADSLSELLEQSDAVSLHVPLTPETFGLVDRRFVAALKPGALLINTARGKTMDLDAVHEGLLSRRIGGTGLDVLPLEPADPSHPLIQAWRDRAPWLAGRLVITPHVAFYNEQSVVEMRRKAAREALRVLEGQQPRNCVNLVQLREFGNRAAAPSRDAPV